LGPFFATPTATPTLALNRAEIGVKMPLNSVADILPTHTPNIPQTIDRTIHRTNETLPKPKTTLPKPCQNPAKTLPVLYPASRRSFGHKKTPQ